MNKSFGLIGFPLTHSRSGEIFREIFRNEGFADYKYHLFPLPSITDLPDLIYHYPDLQGINVTIPHKERILPFLDELDDTAREICAVNTIKIEKISGKRKLIGYNTDAGGFLQSTDFSGFNEAYILGTGGGAKAVEFVLKRLQIPFYFVSRNSRSYRAISYQEFNNHPFHHPVMIVNTTPLGMFPDILSFPDIPYQKITPDDFLYDLIYNPEQTPFLARGAEMGAKTQNGALMLRLQAEISFKIWQNEGENAR